MSTEIRPDKETTRAAEDHPFHRSDRKTSRQAGKTSSKPSKFLLTLGGLALLSLIGLIALNSGSRKSSKQVLTHKITRGDLVVSVTEDGTLESSNNKEIKCKVKGGSTVLSVVESGTLVKAGDELVRMDTSAIEDNISSQQILYENSLANKTTTESDVEVAKIGITEYLEGVYEQDRKTIENEIYTKEQDLKRAELSFQSIKRSVARGLVSQLQLQGEAFSVNAARKDLELSRKKLDVLDNYTKSKTLIGLRSVLKATEARYASDTEALKLEEARLKRAKDQLKNCVIRAESDGMVIYPSAAEWKEQPDIKEGATVREDQILLIMPDLKQMQVKVGIHESKVDRLKIGMRSQISMQDRTIAGEIASIASITKPTGWWNGNVVKYDTVIQLNNQDGLKPGMSVAVEVFLAEYRDVLTVPVAAVIQHNREFSCWVETQNGIVERKLQLGDSNERFIVVESGLQEGDRVVLNPIDFVTEAQTKALQPSNQNRSDQNTPPTPNSKAADRPTGKKAAAKKSAPPKAKLSKGAELLKMGDKNGDGVLTKDEFDEKTKPYFESIDTDSNGEVNAAEIDASLKRASQGAGTK